VHVTFSHACRLEGGRGADIVSFIYLGPLL
jgi:hypothetical protein